MTIDEKIAFWQQVMAYANDRGIKIMWFTWNIFITPADPKYNFKPESDEALQYMYKSVKKMVETYPHLSGFGVTAGERMGMTVGKYTATQWMWEAYGKAIADVKREYPERPFRFIFRRHHTTLAAIEKDFAAHFPGKVETSYKYSVAHMYSSTKPPIFEQEYQQDVLKYNYKCWMNVRNDDIFCFRWGDPDYVRDYLVNMMKYPVPGFYMGSDGYLWGREFTSKNPKLSGELETKKHWYPYLLWGRLGYNPNIPNTHFKNLVAARFAKTNADDLFNAWQMASKTIPLVNNFHWQPGDEMWAVEGCMNNIEGFQTVRDFIDCFTLETTLLQDISAYVKMVKKNEQTLLKTPLQVADSLRYCAQMANQYLDKATGGKTYADDALNATIGDIRCLALYGEYYAGKIAAATYLHLYESIDDENKASYKQKALDEINLAVEAWKKLAVIADNQYKPQHLARTHVLDWKNAMSDVEKDAEIIRTSTGSEPRIAKLFLSGYVKIDKMQKQKLIGALESKGYQVIEVRAWELNGHATGLKIVVALEGDLVHGFFLNHGGVLPQNYAHSGIAQVLVGTNYWTIVKDGAMGKKAIEMIAKKIEQGEIGL